jgi:uncharacterized flavoprotein (TIGR03862 family)
MPASLSDIAASPKPERDRFATVIGAGPAGLMAAERLARGGVSVIVFDRMPSPARKLLMAGVGGLNITHNEPLPDLVSRYGDAAAWLGPAIERFPPAAIREWCAGLGQPTFVGSSGRVFPTAMKASPLLRAWLARLAGLGVEFRARHRWLGWDDAGGLLFEPATSAPGGATVLALGGASWPRLGSDGAWVTALPPGAVAPLKPANCGFVVPWSTHFRERFEGAPLKRVVVRFGDQAVPGDAVITAAGVEGGPFYALCSALRDTIAMKGEAIVTIDLRPDLPWDAVGQRLAAPRRGQSLSNFLRKAVGLSPLAINLLRECGSQEADLTTAIKALKLRLTATSGLARAISTAGGVRAGALTDGSLPPGVFVAGEMLDWEAPTGGYLLQAAFSTGYAAGEDALAWLGRERS